MGDFYLAFLRAPSNGRMMRMSGRRVGTTGILAVAVVIAGGAIRAAAVKPAARSTATLSQQPKIQPRFITGTWQVVARKNMTTGEVDSVPKNRTEWMMVSPTHWTYVWMELGRTVTTPAELAAMAEEQRRQANYAKIYNDKDQNVFWASGGEYHIQGDRFVVARDMSIEPYWVSVRSYDQIVYLDSTTYIYHDGPNKQGVITQVIHHRID
jgi:hypothetical protein